MLQTEFMRDMMTKYGGNIICMDSTHGTNMYDFLLVSVMVIDEHGEGIPVAWAISNHEDTSTLVHFLAAVKSRVGDIKPTLFMSDDAEAFFNAWQGVFGVHKETQKLLCTFHVDRAWRKNLNEHIKDKQEMVEAYHHLRVLLMERDRSKFHLLMQQFLSLMLDKHQAFYTYFVKKYATCPHVWAACYRVGTTANTNMHLESFHRKLKIVYLESKQNRRLDHLLHVLFKIARDLIFESFRKFEIGKVTHRKAEITKRHNTATKLDPALVEVANGNEEENVWNVRSATDGSATHCVRLEAQTCDCKMRCERCKACVHMYTCICLDATLHYTVCKHVHLVQMHYSGKGNKDNSDDSVCDNEVEESDDVKCSNEEDKGNKEHDSEEEEGSNEYDNEMEEGSNEYDSEKEEGSNEHDNEEEEGNDKHDNDSDRGDDMESEEDNESGGMECGGYDEHSTTVYGGSKEGMRAYYSRMLRQDRATEEITHLHQGIHELLQELDMIQSQCFNAEVLSTAKKHLSAAVCTVKASHLYPKQFGISTIPIRKRPAPNANHEKQIRFYSTKKKRVTKERCAKPTLVEKESSKVILNNVETQVCGVCCREEDTFNAGVDYVDWLQCGICAIWIHSKCCEDCEDKENFVCTSCTQD